MALNIMFTVLPNGVDSTGRLKLSLFVTPIADASGTRLGDTVFSNWTSLIQGLDFKLVWQTPGGVSDEQSARFESRGRLDASIWPDLFDQNLLIKAPEYPSLVNKTLVSFDSGVVSSELKRTYKGAAKNRAPLHRVSAAARTSERVSKSVFDVAEAMRDVPLKRADIKLPSATLRKSKAYSDAGLRGEMLRAALLLGRKQDGRSTPAVAQAVAPPPAPTTTAPDFCQILAHLGDHAWLLRRLGIIIDLTIPRFGNGEKRALKLAPSLVINGAVVFRPWTSARVTANDFQSCLDQQGGDTDADHAEAGYLRTSTYRVEDLDVDHAASQYASFAQEAERKVLNTPGNAIDVGLPAFRTAGLAVHRKSREDITAERLENLFNHEYTRRTNPDQLNFVRRDLVRGYRVDIKQGTGPWRSVCKRIDRVKIKNRIFSPTDAELDEGYVKASGVTESHDDPEMIRLPESLFLWDGWSLVAPRPGLALVSGPSGEEKLAKPTTGAPAEGVPFTSHVVPAMGSLPKLRFGETYRLRVRQVDAAGNDLAHTIDALPEADYALKLTDVDNPGREQAALRFEPLSSPVLLNRVPVTEGESLERLVVRSNPYGLSDEEANQAIALATTPEEIDRIESRRRRSADAYATWVNSKNQEAAAVGKTFAIGDYYRDCDRHVAPPKTSYQMAELHGAFDTLFSGPLSEDKVKLSYLVASKESGTFLDHKVMNTLTGVTSDSNRNVVTPPGARNADGTKPTPIGKAALGKRGDPLAHGQYVTYEQAPEQMILPYLPDPSARSFVLRGLPQSYQRTFALRTGATAWPEVGIFGLKLIAIGSGATEVRGHDGTAPTAATPISVRLPAGGILRLRYSCAAKRPEVFALCDGDSDSAEVAGKGEHPMVTPSREVVLVHAVQMPAKPTMSDNDISLRDRAAGQTQQELSGAIFVDPLSTDLVELVASWNEYADASLEFDDDAAAAPARQSGVVGSFRVKNDNPRVDIPSGTVQSFGDTKRRDVTYQAIATSRFREYFPIPLGRDAANITNRSAPLKHVVRSSCRPPAPDIVCVVPTFLWLDAAGNTATNITRTRQGRGLRVYVRRPWFITGEDERLGLVLAKSTPDLESNPQLVTTFGDDCIWNDKGALTAVKVENVASPPPPPGQATDPYGTLLDVALAENPNIKVNVVTSRPQYNPERGLWYFDFTFTGIDKYFPFTRLALARVQAESVADLRLSTIVRSDIAQVLPDRAVAVVKSGTTCTVSLTGVSGSRTTAASGERRIRVQLQTTTNASADATDWTTVKTGTPPVSSVTLPLFSTSGSSATYKGTLTLPTNIPSTTRRRLFVTEHEVYTAGGEAESWRAADERLIYASAVELQP